MSRTHRALSGLVFIASFSLILTVARAQSPGQANAGSSAASATPPPVTWIDTHTGHRVIRLTDQPGSLSLYFNVPAFTPDGKQMLYTVNRKIYLVDLETRESRLLVSGPVRELAVARNGAVVYFTKVVSATRTPSCSARFSVASCLHGHNETAAKSRLARVGQ